MLVDVYELAVFENKSRVAVEFLVHVTTPVRVSTGNFLKSISKSFSKQYWILPIGNHTAVGYISNHHH